MFYVFVPGLLIPDKQVDFNSIYLKDYSLLGSGRGGGGSKSGSRSNPIKQFLTAKKE